MRIAHILWSLGTGGTENMVVDIANAQAETEEVAIFVINDVVEQYIVDRISPKCHLYLFNRKVGTRSFIKLIKFNVSLQVFNPDVIHIHARKLLRCVKLCRKVKKVRTLHGLIHYSEELSGFDKLFSISEAVREHTLKKGFDSVVVANGIKVCDVNAIRNNPFTDGKLHFVQVGRLHVKTKGQDLSIGAIAKLKAKGVDNVILHLIGDGPSKDKLLELVEELGVADMVVFEGRREQKEIYQTLANYDLLLQPSREEGFGLTIAEAMAAKVPVLVSDIPAPIEVIDNGKYGLKFQKGDAEDLSKTILSFIHRKYDMSLVPQAYQYVTERYDVTVTAKRYLEEYEKMLLS